MWNVIKKQILNKTHFWEQWRPKKGHLRSLKFCLIGSNGFVFHLFLKLKFRHLSCTGGSRGTDHLEQQSFAEKDGKKTRHGKRVTSSWKKQTWCWYILDLYLELETSTLKKLISIWMIPSLYIGNCCLTIYRPFNKYSCVVVPGESSFPPSMQVVSPIQLYNYRNNIGN